MPDFQQNDSVADSQTKFPFKIFISHKVSEHGNAVKELKKILNIKNALKDKLKIFISTAIKPGEDWGKKLYDELDEADMLLYMYCFNSPPKINDWCSYETGYYAKKSNQSGLITIVPPGAEPPSPLKNFQHIELTEEGIKNLLRRIYVQEGIYPDLFDEEFKEDLDSIVESILKIFSPSQKPISLSPRIWITLNYNSIETFRDGRGVIPQDSTITGETEAARKFGYEAHEKEEITLEKLKEIVEFKGTLDPFFTVLSDTLKDILNKRRGPWRVPPVKVISDRPPSVLIPAYLEKMANGDHKFEFIVSEPPKNFIYRKEDRCLMGLYNLFIVAWHFRWRVVYKYLHELRRLASADREEIKADAAELVWKLKVDLNAVILDSFNRELQFPGDITQFFEGKDRKILEKIVDSREGLWGQLVPEFESACDDLNLEKLIECLDQMQDMNKTCIAVTLKLLFKKTHMKLDGKIDEESEEALEA